MARCLPECMGDQAYSREQRETLDNIAELRLSLPVCHPLIEVQKRYVPRVRFRLT